MPDLQELLRELIELPQRQYSDLIRRVDAERRRAVEREESHQPLAGMSKKEFAQWIGRNNFAIDKGITRILYLPTGAPPEEVRLLEVNELAHIPENAPIEAIDFGLDIEGVRYQLFVADVTPNQIEGIQSRIVPLPEGWSLDDAEEIHPR